MAQIAYRVGSFTTRPLTFGSADVVKRVRHALLRVGFGNFVQARGRAITPETTPVQDLKNFSAFAVIVEHTGISYPIGEISVRVEERYSHRARVQHSR